MKSLISRFPASAEDYHRLARRRLPRFLFDYLDGGAGDEATVRNNRAALNAVQLRQRVLIDVDGVDTAASLLGETCRMPLALAPTGAVGLMAHRGEVQAARAAQSQGIPMTLSTVSVCGMDEVAQAVERPFWFQLYMLRDRSVVEALLERARNMGCHNLVFTVDLPKPGMRHRDKRNGLGVAGTRAQLLRTLQVLSRPRWLWNVALRGRPLTFGNLTEQVPGARNINAFMAWVDSQFDPGVTWEDIAWLRKQWHGNLILKGIMDVEDARQAVHHGAQALIVSNHGGRQLDSAAASISKLPAIAAAAGTELEVLADGGIQSGTDLFKTLALGAHGAMIGRAALWALAAGGQSALEDLLRTFQQELMLTMALTGVNHIADIGAQHLERLRTTRFDTRSSA